MANWKNCKYCGQLYDRNIDKQILSFLFLGFKGLERTNYCCENHFEIHTGKSLSAEKGRAYKLVGGIVVLFILLIMIAKCSADDRNVQTQTPGIDTQTVVKVKSHSKVKSGNSSAEKKSKKEAKNATEDNGVKDDNNERNDNDLKDQGKTPD